MKNIRLIFRKELGSYLASPMAYIVTAVFLAITGISFSAYLANANYADTNIRGFLTAGQVLILLFAAVLTMRLVAEERKQGTWELLLTVPVRDSEIILGKFTASLAVLTGMLLLTFYYSILLLVFGDPDLGPIFTSYVGLFLLGCASLAVGIFASSLTSNQIVSSVLSGGILFALWILGLARTLIPGAAGDVLARMSLSGYFPDFIRGVVDTKAVVYYLSITAVFLYMSIKSTESDRKR